MTYEEVKQRLDEWYESNMAEISPEVLDCCYKAIVRVLEIDAMENEKVKIELVKGYEGKSVYIDDYRVAGSKLWGIGHTEQTWIANKKNILMALGIKI